MDYFNIFQQTNIIRTRLENQSNWVNNSIIDVDTENNIIEISFKSEYVDSGGVIIEARMGENNYLYLAKGVVKEVIMNFPKSIKVQISSLERLENIRTSYRYDVNLNAIIKGVDIANFDSSTVVNMSSLGIALISKENLTIGTDIFVDVFLDESRMLKLRGNPVWKKVNGYNMEYGINIFPVDDPNIKLFNSYIDELEYKEENSLSVIKRIRSNSQKATE